MLTPEPMQRATVFLLDADIAAAMAALARSGVFAPEGGVLPAALLPEAPGLALAERYHSARTRFAKLVGACGSPLPPSREEVQPVEAEALAEMDDWLGAAWLACSRQIERVQSLDREIQRLEALLASLDTFARFGVDLERLREGGRFLDVRVGTVAREDLPRLAAALRLVDYVLQPFGGDDGQRHCLLAGPRGREATLLPLLRSAGWHPLALPPEFVGSPEAVRTRLENELALARARREEAAALLARLGERYRERLAEAADLLFSAAPHAQAAEALRARGSLAALTGWVPRDGLTTLRRQLDQDLGGRYLLELSDPRPEEVERVPSLTRHPRWLAPFAALVRTYGVPRYGEIDPTPLFALSYLALFGLMFGDVGHGAVIAILGLALPRLLPRFAAARPLMVGAGLSSLLCGVLYGSVFGFEDWIRPLWVAPLSDPPRMLLAAVGSGMGFVVVATLLGMINRVREGRLPEALFGPRGLAGLAVYLASAHLAARLAMGEMPGPGAVAALFVPLAVLLVHLWRGQPAGQAERLALVAVEALESLIAYFANTLSFLRVAAFSLNHAALAAAVFAIARLMHGTGHALALVSGNLFILTLEAAVVAIQALRLEYYEGFSRFYGGSGRPFTPLRPVPPLSPAS